MRRETTAATRVLLYAVLATFTFMTLYPILWLLLSSFKTTQEFQMNRLGLPRNWTFSNYPLAWRIGGFSQLFLNSALYTLVSTLATVGLSLAASFAFAKIKCRATPFLHGSFVVGILLTLQSIMVPLFLAAYATGLYNTRLGVLIPYVGIGLPIGIYLSTEYIKSIPDSIVESARIDGASYFEIFTSIIVPMARPVATTLAILNVAGIWNEFMLINILVSKNSLKSLPVGILKFSGALSSDYGKQFAALVIGMLPMLAFYAIFRNQITKGVSAGAVKG
ncbi:MAG: carbohydrate ABC transporter permease [Firmicutes bacterium]|jgi:raffinose/stachyose/melibiose transport system permease protein|nr:carbohydrate ABC transporter permease [Bacillota bacterium]